LIAVLTTGGPNAPTVLQAARLALRPAALAAPAQSSQNSDVLDRSVEGVAYPYWEDSSGWRAAGARTDRLAGRTVTTVFYTYGPRAHSGAHRIGYAIVAGHALAVPVGREVSSGGIDFRVLASEGATVVTWRRAGRTCILAARGVAGATLVHLATLE
jgi:hypothetical protein